MFFFSLLFKHNFHIFKGIPHNFASGNGIFRDVSFYNNCSVLRDLLSVNVTKW